MQDRNGPRRPCAARRHRGRTAQQGGQEAGAAHTRGKPAGAGSGRGDAKGRAIAAGSNAGGPKTTDSKKISTRTTAIYRRSSGRRLTLRELRSADRRHPGAVQPSPSGIGTLTVLQDQSQQMRTGLGVERIVVQLVADDLQLAGVTTHQREIRLDPR